MVKLYDMNSNHSLACICNLENDILQFPFEKPLIKSYLKCHVMLLLGITIYNSISILPLSY